MPHGRHLMMCPGLVCIGSIYDTHMTCGICGIAEPASGCSFTQLRCRKKHEPLPRPPRDRPEGSRQRVEFVTHYNASTQALIRRKVGTDAHILRICFQSR